MATLFLPGNRQSFYFRAVVPRRLRPLFGGRAQLWRSLSTADKEHAKLRSLEWAARTQRLFLLLKTHGAYMSQADIAALIARTMDAELEKSEDYRALHRLDEDQQEIMVDETIERLEETEGTLSAHRYDRIAEEVQTMLRAGGMPALDPNSLPFKRACRAFLLAKQEMLTTEVERWQGQYRPRLTGAALVPAATPPVKKSPLYSVVLKKYLVENPYARRSADQVRKEFEKFQTVIGGDRPIASITKAEGRAYKDHLLNERGVSLRTVAKHLNTLSGLFTWAEKQDYTPEGFPNPAKGLPPSKIDQEKGATKVRPFTDEELLRVFSSPNFLAQRMKRPARYWISLLCLFQLCRREEAAQLALADIGVKDGIPCLTITDRGENQSVKNKGSRRTIPIHSSLIALGFLDYVEAARAQGQTRLFHQLPHRVNGYADAVGKWFAQHLDRVGLSQPELVLHSLRHGIHYLHALGCPQDVAEMLTGHTATTVHDKVYAHRELTPLSRLRDGLEKMQFPAVLKVLTKEGQHESR
ncbi:MAG: hypothetical protein HOP22_06080 [Nitrospiraceae bacterium]|nr:hypothetical protein [Nitrospiraceae bacterium]